MSQAVIDDVIWKASCYLQTQGGYRKGKSGSPMCRGTEWPPVANTHATTSNGGTLYLTDKPMDKQLFRAFPAVEQT